MTAPILPEMRHSNMEVIVERISALHESFGGVKSLVTQLNDRFHQFELAKVKADSEMSSKITAAHTRLDTQGGEIDAIKKSHEAEIAAIKEVLKPLPNLVSAYRAMVVIGSILGASVIGLIWSLITGQAHIVVP